MNSKIHLFVGSIKSLDEETGALLRGVDAIRVFTKLNGHPKTEVWARKKICTGEERIKLNVQKSISENTVTTGGVSYRSSAICE